MAASQEPWLSALTWLGHGGSLLGSGALDGHSLLHHHGAVLARPPDAPWSRPHLRRLRGHRGVASGAALSLCPWETGVRGGEGVHIYSAYIYINVCMRNAHTHIHTHTHKTHTRILGRIHTPAHVPTASALAAVESIMLSGLSGYF